MRMPMDRFYDKALRCVDALREEALGRHRASEFNAMLRGWADKFEADPVRSSFWQAAMAAGYTLLEAPGVTFADTAAYLKDHSGKGNQVSPEECNHQNTLEGESSGACVALSGACRLQALSIYCTVASISFRYWGSRCLQSQLRWYPWTMSLKAWIEAAIALLRWVGWPYMPYGSSEKDQEHGHGSPGAVRDPLQCC